MGLLDKLSMELLGYQFHGLRERTSGILCSKGRRKGESKRKD